MAKVKMGKGGKGDSKKLYNFFVTSIVTFFGIGKIPIMRGTLGSFAALIIILLMFYQPHFTVKGDNVSYFNLGSGIIRPDLLPYIIILSAIIIHITGVYFSDIYSKRIGKKDPKEVVIDEVAGMFTSVALAIVIYALLLEFYYDSYVLYLMLAHYYFIALFILFRVFDILKPWHVAKAEKLKGGEGIMWDDQVAAIYAVISFYAIFHLLKYIGFLDQFVEMK